MTTGSDLLIKISQFGPSLLSSLKIDDLHALLVNSDPQGVVSRPNKTQGLEKVRSLATVKAALLRHASAATATQAPELPPRPPQILLEEQIRYSFGSIGSSVSFPPAVGPVVAVASDVAADLVVSVHAQNK